MVDDHTKIEAKQTRATSHAINIEKPKKGREAKLKRWTRSGVKACEARPLTTRYKIRA